MFDPIDESVRRLCPRPWDHDYLLLSRLAAAIRKLIDRRVAHERPGTVVDYGCGSAPYRCLFSGCSERYVCADLDSNPVADVHIDCDGRLPLDDGSVDVILSAQVLEHVLDADVYLQECSRLLRPGGWLVLSTHGSWFYHPHPTDLRRWTAAGLTHDVQRASLVVEDMIACQGPLAYTTQMRLVLAKGMARKLGRLGDVLIAPISLICQGLMYLEDAITPRDVLENNATIYVLAARKTPPSRANDVRYVDTKSPGPTPNPVDGTPRPRRGSYWKGATDPGNAVESSLHPRLDRVKACG